MRISPFLFFLMVTFCLLCWPFFVYCTSLLLLFLLFLLIPRCYLFCRSDSRRWRVHHVPQIADRGPWTQHIRWLFLYGSAEGDVSLSLHCAFPPSSLSSISPSIFSLITSPFYLLSHLFPLLSSLSSISPSIISLITSLFYLPSHLLVSHFVYKLSDVSRWSCLHAQFPALF